MNPTDPIDRLDAARAAASSGDFETALREHIWFHHHALEIEPSLYGVRLSFALADWKELAADFPPAERALLDIRDAKVRTLLAGRGTFHLAHDVVAINDCLSRGADTVDLFRQLHAVDAALAAECGALALPAIAAQKAYTLARTYIKDADEYIRYCSVGLNASIALDHPDNVPVEEMERLLVTNYITQVRLILDTLNAVGEPGEAERVCAKAIAAVENAKVRQVVQRELQPIAD